MTLKLAVGLGNPGARYEGTRHNVGFRVIDLVASKLQISVNRHEHKSLTGRATVGGEQLLLAKPLMYMNNSGEAVRSLLDYYRIDPAQLLVIYDDLDLPLGRLRMRAQGSAGGHNGMKSIIKYLGTDVVARLRIGIGAVPDGMEGVDYVLSRFNDSEQAAMLEAYSGAAAAVLSWAEHGTERTIAMVNRRLAQVPPTP
jgi:PTH1 family peptidyl-tRNA hydrolase